MVLTKAQAKSLDILEVARSLGMEMKRKSHREYYWAEHDSFKIDTVKNTWHWYSQNLFGDTINLVQQMQNVSYKEAMVFLETGSFPEAKPVEEERKPFNYTLAPYEQPFVEARTYLKEIRGLSDDTIDFFMEKGVLSQAKRKDKDGVIEDVLVFKYLDRNQQLVGASLQGLVPDQERYPGKGYLKQIMYQSEAISGLNVSIGSPKRLIVTEAPIDLMSYYELHKDELNDVRLVAMEGLKEGVLSHYVLEILQERGDISMDERDYTKSSELARASRFLSVAAETSTLFQDHKYDDLITLAVDRDKAGTDFITKLREKKIPVVDARPPKREGQEKTDWNEILKQEKQLEQTEEIQASSHFPDTSHLSPEDAAWLKENWNNIGFSVEPRKQMVIDSDKTVTYEKPSNPLGDGREPKKQIQSTEKAPESSQEQMNDRASGGEGYSQHDAVGSAEPEAESSATFEQTVASHPTSPYRYLHFSTTFEDVQRRQSKYHPITSDDLKRMNQYAGSIQKSSQWYLEELANSKIYYFYSNNGEVSLLDVNFKRENFLHLTGIRPVVPGRNAGDFVVDFAEGRGDYNQILVSNSLKEKLQVIPMLEDILDPKSFVLDNLDEVRIAQRLNFSEAIKSKDEDFLLLFKDIGDERVPASLMKIKRDLRVDVEKTKEKVILGVFRERDGHIEQLSINEDYVKDRGNELQTILKDGLFEEIKPDITKEIEQTTPENTLNSPLLDSATFTQVLDTVYNLGVPGDISKTPEEFHQAWNQYLDYAKQHNDNFDQIVAAAGEDHLLDTNSDFYKEWEQDHIYKENYHVRVQWAEERPDGPKLPFKETELISYQDFARELYKANQDFYSIHQEGMKQVTAGNTEGYIPPTKIQFSIYAPDGELIQDSIRYNIGEEINPIAHKERLGTREMREHPELMKIDGAIFTQYHLERLANELDISQFSYALEDTPYADQLLSQVPFGVLENSPIGFSDSSHDSRLGFISFDGMDSVEVENLSAWFEKLGVKDSPMEQVALVEKWQKEIKDLSEKVEQTIENIRDEFEKTQEEEIKLEEQGHNKQELKRDADADGVSDDEELLQGTNPYDFRSKPGSKPDVEEGLQAEEVVLAAGSLAVADFTQNTDIGLYIRFNWSENKAIRDRFEEDELVPYEEFIEILYFENERLRPEGNGYYKTSFDIENEKGESYTFGIRYDIGSELYPLSEMMDERFSEEYIEYASKLDKKAIEKVQSELDETKNNQKEIIDADEELKAEEVVLATSSLAVADFIQNKDMAGLSRHLKEGIKDFLDSDKYKDYLTKMSQLNNYSNRNLRLILAQNPEARQVASFKQWKENFGRHVKKGEKALRIFKPMTKIKKDENNQPILDKNGKPETVTFFGLVPVFDVSQTEGKEMPKAAEVKEQLTDLDYANLYRALMAIAKENDVSVRFEEMENNKHGYYSVPENQIVLRSNEMNKAQIIKTFLHEMAHAELHHADNPQKENLTRSTAELQAESVAYVVSSYYGIDTSEYSFNYLSGWSADKETLADLEAQLDIVQQEAKSLMVRMDQALEQLRLSQEKQTKRSFEQKLEKFKDQNKQAVEEHKQELKADAQSKKERGFSK
ncbi:PBECR4 domain-containing protein [Streptococcus infantis]|uniref:PBECR4 domain-containing protein n=1 Tax=Streptococcus infantis TaxID=68892 RepID=UPI0039C29ED1